ncbi:MAG: pyridoxamine 5'-phosphate oxidase [Acidimicrobiales bacterium]|nr:pyridoxamine 5'-phosphate oxidase [Acidimicrobiales bacterium]
MNMSKSSSDDSSSDPSKKDAVEPTRSGGTLPWDLASERLATSKEYWIATVRSSGAPHIMPVWGVISENSFYFSSMTSSIKVRNLKANPHISITSNDPNIPVVAEGIAEEMDSKEDILRFLEMENEKYGTKMGFSAVDPDFNTNYRCRIIKIIAIDKKLSPGGPSTWRFSKSL